MLVCRADIGGWYQAICSLQNRAVVRNQLKSSTSLTLSRAQFPKPLNHERILGILNVVSISFHTRPLLKGFLCSVLVRISIGANSVTAFLMLQDIKQLLHDLEKSLPVHLEVLNSLPLS